MVCVALHHVHIREMTRVLKRGLHCIGEVDSDDFPRLKLRGQKYMPPLSTANIQYYFPREIARIQRFDPVQELFTIRIRQIRVVCPFIAESCSSSLLGWCKIGWQESWNAPNDAKFRATPHADKCAVHDFRPF